MKIKKIVFALAVSSISTFAYAVGVTPTQIESARGAGTLDEAWIAGTSAAAMPIYKGWTKGCQAGTGSIFYASQHDSEIKTEPGFLGQFVAYACKRGGRTSVLYHTTDGGSLNVFSPFTKGTKLARISYLGTNVNCIKTDGYINSLEPVYNADLYQGCSTTGGQVALDSNDLQTYQSNNSNAGGLALDWGPQQIIGGFSDVEPTMFSEAIGGGSVTSFGTLNNASLGQAFGVAVSIPLYRKLQQIQGISEAATAFSPDLAPSLKKAQIASIFVDGGAVQAAESWLPILGVEEGEKVIIQREKDGSGTQAASNIFFLGNPCLGDSSVHPASITTGNFQVGVNHHQWSVKYGISAASRATAGSRYAIGILPIARNDWRVENPVSYGSYRFIKVDNSHPEAGDTIGAHAAAASGDYTFHLEIKTFIANSATPGFQKNIIPSIVNAIKTPGSTDACRNLSRGLTMNPDISGFGCWSGEQKAKFTNFGNNCSPALLFE